MHDYTKNKALNAKVIPILLPRPHGCPYAKAELCLRQNCYIDKVKGAKVKECQGLLRCAQQQ